MSIDINNNDELNGLRGVDLQDVLVQIENTLLSYRSSLDLPNEVSFGVEIEYENLGENIARDFIKNNISEDSVWNLKSDSTVRSGGEITSPILYDNINSWKELQLICNFLTDKKVDVLHNAGGHVHVGASYLGKNMDAWRQFLKLFAAYENIILRYSFGERINERKGLKQYANLCAKKIYDKMEEINDMEDPRRLHGVIYTSKYYAVNFGNVSFLTSLDKNSYKNTIEFRCPNATVNEIIWQNNINTFTKMIVAAHDNVMDEEFLDYKLKNKFKNDKQNNQLYNIINLKDALEFVDLVFDKNIDKIYFLRQYLKDLNECQNATEPVMSKTFYIKKVIK